MTAIFPNIGFNRSAVKSTVALTKTILAAFIETLTTIFQQITVNEQTTAFTMYSTVL